MRLVSSLFPLLLALAAPALAPALAAQSAPATPPAPASAAAPRYRPARDTLLYAYDNPFRLYWLRGADTVGAPQRGRGVERHTWRGSDARPVVVVHDVELDVQHRTRRDTFTLSPRGRVLLVNDSALTIRHRVDLLLSLPPVPLVLGARWTDTLATRDTDEAGTAHYEIIRSYRVEHVGDTLGTRIADVSASGTLRYRFGFAADSTGARVAWVDLEGPVAERYRFDVARGRVVYRSWHMDLTGRGVPPEGAADTLPAGLRSHRVMRAEPDTARLRFLLQPLPGTDTSATVDTERGSIVLLHTVRRARGAITSSLARNDGMVGVAEATFGADARPSRYEATWADSTTLVTQRLTRRRDVLVLARTGSADTTIGVPHGRWGVADYAMQELLVPALLELPRNGVAEPLAVFRPVARRWDIGMADAEERGGLVVVTIQWEGERGREVLILTRDGDYLFGENAGPRVGRRVPANASRIETLMAAMERMKPKS